MRWRYTQVRTGAYSVMQKISTNPLRYCLCPYHKLPTIGALNRHFASLPFFIRATNKLKKDKFGGRGSIPAMILKRCPPPFDASFHPSSHSSTFSPLAPCRLAHCFAYLPFFTTKKRLWCRLGFDSILGVDYTFELFVVNWYAQFMRRLWLI